MNTCRYATWSVGGGSFTSELRFRLPLATILPGFADHVGAGGAVLRFHQTATKIGTRAHDAHFDD